MHLFAICALIVIAYYGIWNAYFWSDDFWVLGAVRHKDTLFGAFFSSNGYAFRPILNLVLWIRVRWFDLNAAYYYHSALAQHIVVTFLVYWLADYLSRNRIIALLASVLVGTTFAHYMVTTWISGSNYSLAAIPYLLTVISFALFLENRRRVLFFFSVTTFTVTLLISEIGLSLPVILLLYQLVFHKFAYKDDRYPWKEFRIYIPYWLIFLLYVSCQIYYHTSYLAI